MIHDMPATAAELIELLDQKYPHRCANPGDTEREIWMKVGKRQLVDELMTSLNNKTD